MTTYEQSPDYTPAQKLAFIGCLALIALVAVFLYQFFLTYRSELNQGIFYGLAFLGFLLLIVATYSALYALAMLTLIFKAKQQAIKTTAANNALFNATTGQINAGMVYLSEQKTDQGIIRFKHLPKPPKAKPAEPLLSLPEPLALPDIKDSLLSDIEQTQRLLIVGGQNSGKTTLLKHIAHQRSGAGSVLVLDSHNTAGKWARDYKIIGHGRDYPAIERELKNLVTVMDNRYKELASGKVGEREHERITVICDEWTTVSKNLNNLDTYLLPLLTESRKVGIDLMLATHSQTAESLGLKGKADLKSAFDAVLILKNISGKRIVELDNGELVSVYQHCGQFVSNEPVSSWHNADFQNKLDDILSNPIIKSDLEREQRVIDKYHELIKTDSYSLKKLTKLIHGYANGVKMAEIKQILESHGIVTSQ